LQIEKTGRTHSQSRFAHPYCYASALTRIALRLGMQFTIPQRHIKRECMEADRHRNFTYPTYTIQLRWGDYREDKGSIRPFRRNQDLRTKEIEEDLRHEPGGWREGCFVDVEKRIVKWMARFGTGRRAHSDQCTGDMLEVVAKVF